MDGPYFSGLWILPDSDILILTNMIATPVNIRGYYLQD